MSDDMDYITSPLTSPGNIQSAVTNSLPSTVYLYCTVLYICTVLYCIYVLYYTVYLHCTVYQPE